MKRPSLWFVFFLVVGAVGLVGVVGVIVVNVYLPLVAESFFPDSVDKDAVAYSAETHIDGYSFQVAMHRNHPTLAEYRKVMQVKRAGKLVLEREFLDTGGLASFYFLRQANRITVLDGGRNGFVLDVASGEISKVDLDAIPRELAKESFGRFMFVHVPHRVYRWVPKEDLPEAQ